MMIRFFMAQDKWQREGGKAEMNDKPLQQENRID